MNHDTTSLPAGAGFLLSSEAFFGVGGGPAVSGCPTAGSTDSEGGTKSKLTAAGTTISLWHPLHAIRDPPPRAGSDPMALLGEGGCQEAFIRAVLSLKAQKLLQSRPLRAAPPSAGLRGRGPAAIPGALPRRRAMATRPGPPRRREEGAPGIHPSAGSLILTHRHALQTIYKNMKNK